MFLDLIKILKTKSTLTEEERKEIVKYLIEHAYSFLPNKEKRTAQDSPETSSLE